MSRFHLYLSLTQCPGTFPTSRACLPADVHTVARAKSSPTITTQTANLPGTFNDFLTGKVQEQGWKIILIKLFSTAGNIIYIGNIIMSI